ncbi:hypothetical protein [Clostridium perfringens]|uniref:hypothetical protein n=1 Tax=Clostridium perfringens TaxID=1502 RepID=UPI00351431E9|nr:hypothetical protein [Clostridium perfringens]
MKKITLDKIHEKHKNNKASRKEINKLYKKIYLYYINLIEEDDNFDLGQEITFVKWKINKYDNEALKHFKNIIINLGSGLVAALFTILVTNNLNNSDIKTITITTILIFILIYISVYFIVKRDVVRISKENLYYSVCLLVLKDLEEELL